MEKLVSIASEEEHVEQTELQPRQEAPIVKREHDPLDPFQQATKDDLVLPFRALVQGVSRKADVSKAGQFWDELSNTYKPEMLVSLIALRRTRTLFNRANFTDPPVCSSNDAITPRESVQFKGEQTGPTCEDCSFSQWGSGEGQGQACDFTYNLICYDLDDQDTFILRVGGVSRGAWKKYLTAGQRQGIPGYAVATTIGSEPKQFPKGAARVLTFKGGGMLPEEIILEMRGYAAQFQGVDLGVPEVEVEELPF